MAYSIQLASLFKQAFGYEPPAPGQNEINLPKAGDRIEMSNLGQPFYESDALGREFFLPVKLNDYLVPFAVIETRWKKTVVKTAMPERGGTVKELISIEDYPVNIKGMFVRDADEFPESEIKELHSIFEKNASITIRSVLTDIFLRGLFDHKIVIEEVSWPSIVGVQNVKPFSIQAESDMIFTLEL
jgi:hypothetical protein